VISKGEQTMKKKLVYVAFFNVLLGLNLGQVTGYPD
jgi:hypothetical protein